MLFGIGLGATSSMFLTGYLFCRRFEERPRVSIRDLYAAAGIDVSDLSDYRLEQIALDIVAEFGDDTPHRWELVRIVERHRRTPDLQPYVPPATFEEIFDFERRGLNGTKDRAIREHFGFTPARYYQLLYRYSEDPEAQLYDPVLTGRIRRERTQRRLLRTGAA